MSLLGRISSKERRALADPQPWVVQMLGKGATTTSGVWVNPDTALRLAAVFACVRVIAEGLAMLPIKIYRRGDNGRKTEEPGNPLYSILHDQPNPFQTAFEFVEMMTGHVLLRGNAYAYIDRADYDGRNLDLFPLHPDRIKPYLLSTGRMAYEYRPISGPVKVFLQEEIFHLRGYSTDGIIGISPVTLMREAIGQAMAAEEFASRFYSNDATPPMVFRHPEELSPTAYNRLRQSIQEQHAGLANAHKPWILEEGMEVKKVGVSPRDAQYLEGRKFSVVEIARIFRVPPHMIADLDRATFSNIEQLSIEFVKFSLMPWIARWQQAIKARLMSAKSQATLEARFYLRDLLLGDMAARGQYYAIMRNWGLMNANECRADEDLNPREDPGGEAYLEPLNMTEEGIGNANGGGGGNPRIAPPGKKGAPPAEPDPADDQERQLRAASLGLARAQAGRFLSKETKELDRLAARAENLKAFEVEVEKFYRERFADAPVEHVRESRRLLREASGTNLRAAIAGWETGRVEALAEIILRDALSHASEAA
jgi:HK97 family phage portal protein